MVIKFRGPSSRRTLSSREFENILLRSLEYLQSSRPRLLPKPSPKPHIKNPAA